MTSPRERRSAGEPESRRAGEPESRSGAPALRGPVTYQNWERSGRSSTTACNAYGPRPGQDLPGRPLPLSHRPGRPAPPRGRRHRRDRRPVGRPRPRRGRARALAPPPSTGLDHPLLATARAAVDLLADPRRLTLRVCPSEDCGRLFLDATGRRRWCSPATCGGGGGGHQ
ncbi:CGNR zinc finger domain-containing protein [Streptomyces sp. NPDC055103]